MMKKAKPARKHSSAVLATLLENITPIEQAKVEQKMTLAARIGDLLGEKGWSKKAFAEKLGKNPSEITKWLSGTHNFTLDTLTEISFVLGVTVPELYAPKQVQVVHVMHAQVTQRAEPNPGFMTSSSLYLEAMSGGSASYSPGLSYGQVSGGN
jgi:transcriptional regulator with XRE-family HTH domain